MTTTVVVLLVVVLLVSGLLLWTVHHAAVEARAVVDRLVAVRDRVVPLAEQVQADAERAADRLAALPGTGDAEPGARTYPRGTP